MAMDADEHTQILKVNEFLSVFSRKCTEARAAGGIHVIRICDTVPIPEGWVLDPFTQYYLPPNVILL